MTRWGWSVVVLLATVSGTALAAQRSFVSGTGVDSNPCTRDLPCRSFAAALLTLSANGEVVAIDSAGYGPVVVTQAATIVAPPGVHAGISVFSGDGVTISAPSNAAVALRNLFINSQGGYVGIRLTSANEVDIERCVVSGFASDNIHLTPALQSTVRISDTVIRRAADAGVYADSASSLTVSIDRCRIDSNADGILIDRASVTIGNSTADANSSEGIYARGTGGSAWVGIESSVISNSPSFGVLGGGGSTVVAHNTMAFKNSAGFASYGAKLSLDHVVASGGFDGVHVFDAPATVSASALTDNSDAGIYVDAATVRLTGNTVTRNANGVSIWESGTAYSTGDNMISDNVTDVLGSLTALTKN